MKREENNKRVLVAKHYFEPNYGSIVKKGCTDGLFRVEYSTKKVRDNSKEKVFHIIHESTETEIPFVEGFSRYQPAFDVVLQNIVHYGIKIGTLNI